MNRINRPGSANDAMRTFVNTFRSHLREEGTALDDETVWRLLRRLQILVFDFTATGTNSEELAKERGVRALHPDDASRTGELWTVLTIIAHPKFQSAARSGLRFRCPTGPPKFSTKECSPSARRFMRPVLIDRKSVV